MGYANLNSGVTPWDETAYIYMDRDISKLGIKCELPDCEDHATHEVGVEGERWGGIEYRVCDYHSQDVVEYFFEDRGSGEEIPIEE